MVEDGVLWHRSISRQCMCLYLLTHAVNTYPKRPAYVTPTPRGTDPAIPFTDLPTATYTTPTSTKPSYPWLMALAMIAITTLRVTFSSLTSTVAPGKAMRACNFDLRRGSAPFRQACSIVASFMWKTHRHLLFTRGLICLPGLKSRQTVPSMAMYLTTGNVLTYLLIMSDHRSILQLQF